VNQWKRRSGDTPARTRHRRWPAPTVLRDFGQGRGNKAMVKSMADKPIIVAMAHPDPEITGPRRWPRCAATPSWRTALGTIQTVNTDGLPYIFRGAPRRAAPSTGDEDRSRKALGALAREDVPDEVPPAYGMRPKYGQSTSSRAVRPEADIVRPAGDRRRSHGNRRRSSR